MGKNKYKRKNKPSSSGEESFLDSFTATLLDVEHLKQIFHKQTEKKARVETMALSQSQSAHTDTALQINDYYSVIHILDKISTT